MAILQLVDQLSTLLEQGRPVPMSPYRMVNGDEFARIIEHMRISVPSSIRESERTLAERDAILADAEAEAERIVHEAQERARALMSENSLVQSAQREADRIIVSSKEAAQEHARAADAYATEVLHELAEKLRIISQQVDNGIEMLAENRAASALADRTSSQS